MILLLTCLCIFLGFELQKIIQFNLFYKLKCLSIDYEKQITTRVNSVAFKEIIKIVFIDSFLLILMLYGLTTINGYLFFVLFIMSFIVTAIFKKTKITSIRKSILIIDGVLTITLLSLVIINLLFYKISDIQLLGNIFHHLKILIL